MGSKAVLQEATERIEGQNVPHSDESRHFFTGGNGNNQRRECNAFFTGGNGGNGGSDIGEFG